MLKLNDQDMLPIEVDPPTWGDVQRAAEDAVQALNDDTQFQPDSLYILKQLAGMRLNIGQAHPPEDMPSSFRHGS